MTGYSTGVSESCVIRTESTISRVDDFPLPRVTLRKRNATCEREAVITSVNSALLDGLFADVAKIRESSESSAAFEETRSEFEAFSIPPSKKSRTSLTHSISRSAKSFKWLGDALFPTVAELSTISSSFGDLTRQVTPDLSASVTSKFVSHTSSFEGSLLMPSFAKKFSFPHLPPAVSSSSCGALSRVNSDLQSSTTENEEKESYGWFVDIDGELKRDTIVMSDKSLNSNNLAFVASTAPNAENHDDEVEWAKAADTVDSVLGDFF